jgi:hypothetical protein
VLKNRISVLITLFFVLQTIFAGRAWFWNIFSVVPPIFFTLLFLFLIFWNISKKNKYGIAFVLICLPMAWYSSDIAIRVFSDQSGIDSQTIKVFNWNTQFWEHDNKKDFYNFLLEQKADVYHLQEHIMLRNGYFIELDDMAELKQVFDGYTIIKKTEFLTITNLPVVEVFNKEESYYLRVDVQVNKNVLSLYNVHIPVQINPSLLPNVYKFTVDLKHRFDFRNQEFGKLIRDIQSNSNEFYISGDFNTTRSMGKIHEIINMGKDAVLASDNILNATWSVNKLRLWRIDYNIVHNGLKVIEYKEVDPLTYSDHSAQLVTIQL